MAEPVNYLLVVLTPQEEKNQVWQMKLQALCQKISPKEVGFLYILPVLPVVLSLCTSPFYDVSLLKWNQKRYAVGREALQSIKHQMKYPAARCLVKAGWLRTDIKLFADQLGATIFKPLSTWQRLKQRGRQIMQPSIMNVEKKSFVRNKKIETQILKN